MIHFVYQSGMDVYADMAPNVPDLIKNMDKRIVSFLKKREQDFFVPMNNSFRQMIQLHQRTFEMLDVLEPGKIGLGNKLKNPVEKLEKASFKIPEKVLLEQPSEEVEKTEKKGAGIDGSMEAEKKDFHDQMERLEIERSTFEKELKYLLNNLKPNRSISGPKFTCDLPQKEIDRIKVLIHGH